MGYSKGIKWTEEKIISGILEVVGFLKLKRMPTAKEIYTANGNHSLAVKIGRSGGYKYWADKLELEVKECETNLGKDYEYILSEFMSDKGYKVERMETKYPYDLTVNKNVKVDVKVSKVVKNHNYYTFNLQKRNPTCDIFVFYCLGEFGSIEKTYVIPSCELQGKTQLSVGITKSKYDIYIDNWFYFDKYIEFYEMILRRRMKYE